MQAKVDTAVSELLPKFQHTYEFLCEEGTLKGIKEENLAHLAKVISDCVQFVNGYIDMKDICESFTLIFDHATGRCPKGIDSERKSCPKRVIPSMATIRLLML